MKHDLENLQKEIAKRQKKVEEARVAMDELPILQRAYDILLKSQGGKVTAIEVKKTRREEGATLFDTGNGVMAFRRNWGTVIGSIKGAVAEMSGEFTVRDIRNAISKKHPDVAQALKTEVISINMNKLRKKNIVRMKQAAVGRRPAVYVRN